jgi:Rieske Fe-S protein
VKISSYRLVMARLQAIEKSQVNKRQLLVRVTKWSMALFALLLLYVVLDYTIDFRPATIDSSYRFKLREIPVDQPVWLIQDNLTVLLIRRSNRLLKVLNQQTDDLQDPESDSSRQPDFAQNRLRSRNLEYFVAYGTGTDLGCPLVLDNEYSLRESCGKSSYDFAGRAIVGENQFQNLAIPDYNFNHDFSVLTVNP